MCEKELPMNKPSKIVLVAGLLMITALSASPAYADKHKKRDKQCVERFNGWVNKKYGRICIKKNGDVKLTRTSGKNRYTHVFEASLFDRNYGRHKYTPYKISFDPKRKKNTKRYYKSKHHKFVKHEAKDFYNFHHKKYTRRDDKKVIRLGWYND